MLSIPAILFRRRVQMPFQQQDIEPSFGLEENNSVAVLPENVPEDFVIMMRDPHTGYYYFRAGVICSSIGWNLGSKMGLKLQDTHRPIPDYKEKMAFSMDRYFAKLATDEPIQRGSWSFELDQLLYLDPKSQHASIDRLGAEEAEKRIHLRVDWQTLKRLPLSGAIAFNFKRVFTPLAQLRKEPFVPSLALKVLTEGKMEILKYKGVSRTDRIVIPVLRRYEREQIRDGWIPKDWKARTLDESPFFPGWEEMWRKRQGF
jgi:hypothetical protein